MVVPTMQAPSEVQTDVVAQQNSMYLLVMSKQVVRSQQSTDLQECLQSGDNPP
jgi:hypothetical protein